MSSLLNPSAVAANEARVRRVTADTPRQWGKMTAPQMLNHLADSYEVVMGERSGETRITWVGKHILKHLSLRTPLPWPKGVPTGKTVDALRGGTPPSEFAKDVARFFEVRARFIAKLPQMEGASHPFFGPMSAELWAVWGWRHEDHHLRQFGV